MPNKFPENFYWGAATSAHQVEGNNRNDWTDWEEQTAPQRLKAAEKKKWPDYILAKYPNPLQIANYISGRACDHYNRFREDFDIAKSLGHNAHRFSIEWSRIEPEEGKFNEKEIEHYREVIRALRGRGMEPFVTLWHWTLPLWIRDRGGWASGKTVFYFSRFCERIAREFKEEVKFWAVLNEPGLWSAEAYLYGIKPPHKMNFLSLIRVYFNFIKAYRKVYLGLKKIDPDFQIGIAESVEWCGFAPLRPFFDYFRNFFFIRRVKEGLDFIGINYYKGILTGAEVSDMGWAIYPKGLYGLLLKLRDFKIPIFVTENGLADARDRLRAKFIQDHILWIEKAMKEGVDVRGYFHWSLLDNFEWDSGFWPRFGLTEVDYKTMERRVRSSALECKKLLKSDFRSFNRSLGLRSG